MTKLVSSVLCLSLLVALVPALIPLTSAAQEIDSRQPSSAKIASETTAPDNSTALSPEKNSLKLSLPVTKFQLANGLTVLLLEDHSVPMVSYHTWYRVGSHDESPGVTGAAHMLEHMMFKGAKKYSGKDFDRILHENGITNNAFTTYDYTGFYENLPSSKLELMMDVEVDRMSALNLRAEDLKSEREVVKEERRWRVDNNPMGLLNELMMSTIFKATSYKWPVIGHMKDIENYDIDKLSFFYRTFYVPNNAILVLVGDFKTAAVKAMIEKYYGQLTYKPLPRREFQREPDQIVQQNAILRKDVQNTSFVVGFKSVAQNNPDVYALDLAANLLGNGTSSRLYQRLVYQKQTATGASAYNATMKQEGFFAVSVILKPGAAVNDTLGAVYNEIWKMRNKLITPQELQKAKTQVVKENVDSLRTMDGKARALAVNEIVTGSYETLFSDLEKYQAVTAEDIKRVMEKYTDQKQRSIITLEPKLAAAPAPAAEPAAAASSETKTETKAERE